MQRLIVTSDGSHTIYIPELNEHYHSVHGAIQESEHIFIETGFKTCAGSSLSILEIGFGTGLNAFLTALEAEKNCTKVNYTTIEKYPLGDHMVNSLNYASILGSGSNALFTSLHSSPWNVKIGITDCFTLEKIDGDLTSINLSGMYDLIYFDAFGPDKQPEMWTPDVFSKVSDVTKQGGVLVTYSAKGEVKRNLRATGFDVRLLPGPPGKRQIIRAVKK
ncbi:MAG: tRNA (5-methylaminomethyl-2-thiouridine)(34)-methyltransferase MnmD [Chloroflexota bacterium]